MTRSIMALALVATLGGCGGGTLSRGLETVHQPVVSRTDYVFELPATSGPLAPADASALGQWFDTLGLRYGDRVAVDARGYGSGARDTVGSIAARYGLLMDDTPPVTQGVVAPGAMRVIVSRLTATVPGCPDFSRAATPTFSGEVMSNFGCATNMNLASMVADPRDLISGRNGSGTVDAATAAKAIQGYRSAPLTGAGGLKTESSKGN